jgi:uncharacterized membrane protein YtjA (UPF0391 family)
MPLRPRELWKNDSGEPACPWHTDCKKGRRGRFSNESPREVSIMLRLALMFLVIALIAGFFGFFGVAAVSMDFARIVFFVFLVLAVLSLLGGVFRSPPA